MAISHKLSAIVGLLAACAAQSLNGATPRAADTEQAFRPPAVPLVTSDPYLSVWSDASRLTDDVTRHWTHHDNSLVGLIRIDGRAFRLMGNDPREVPALPQVGLQVLPTRSVYDFENQNIHVTLTFMTTALPDDLDVLTRPLSYITWDVRSLDGAEHEVQLFYSTSSQLAVESTDQKVTWSRETMGPLTALRAGTEDQPVLRRAGDDTRIDWGYIYTAASSSDSKAAIGGSKTLTSSFVKDGVLPVEDDARQPRAVRDDQPILAFVFDLGKVAAAPVSRHVIVAYDEVYAINWFGKKLRPFWRRNGDTPKELLQIAERDYVSLTQRCVAFDKELIADLTKLGGARYAQIAALAFRQCLAGTGIAADAHQQPLLFTKENTSNGDLATVDVIFPMDPMLIAFSPTLAKASIVPVLEYSASSHWKFPNAPHDLGTYPIAMGRDDGGEGMPVEESGNMLILCDAIAHEEGNADFVTPWWPQLTQWAKYLEKFGLDPEEQLCTDDFMGHLAHNSNLSVKAILGLAAYGDLCKMRGDKEAAQKYQRMGKEYATHWTRAAADGDHYNLAFDKPNTWSQKYNLVWDKLLGLNVFPPEVAAREIEHYKSVMQRYGVPLDSRTRLTKTDWSLWVATMAEKPADFEALVSPIYDYLDQTTARMPLVDSYVTDNVKSDGMHARPVVGGIFIKMLSDPALWKKWSSRDRQKVGNWAPLPPPPQITPIVPTSQAQGVFWRYTTNKPASGWTETKFDDSGWKEGPGGFGTAGTPGIAVNTTWNTADIWLRREFTMPAGNFPHLQFLIFHDEDVEVFVNGVPAASEGGFVTSYRPLEINSSARELLKPGSKITIAVHCHQTVGGQGIDVGMVNVVER
jgi:Domain of unknown function (DUF4965)/Domain of unknown function (DUF5127)/Domain of unknown function (DUF1793)/Domain of unknown function (DUF4964)